MTTAQGHETKTSRASPPILVLIILLEKEHSLILKNGVAKENRRELITYRALVM